jgi:class 3 adenylate cyclase
VAELPTGTVTFLFTDIEGSTRRWEDHPDAMGKALSRHDSILEEAVEAHRGVVFSKKGDGMAVVLAPAPGAVAAATRFQLELAEETWPGPLGAIRARVGIHTGEAADRDGDFFGPAVNRASRLMAIGHGGQVPGVGRDRASGARSNVGRMPAY